jgi:uncharacterized BrkB/YihY/UPF0761 family membrane protein
MNEKLKGDLIFIGLLLLFFAILTISVVIVEIYKGIDYKRIQECSANPNRLCEAGSIETVIVFVAIATLILTIYLFFNKNSENIK